MRFWYWSWRGFAYEYSRKGKHFRKGPVPYTRCRRGGYGYFRYPGTIQEIKRNRFDLQDEYVKEYKIKIRRRRSNIPTAWDDITRSEYNNRSWKRHRKHQWKGE